MSEVHPRREEQPPPAAMPMLLSFVAGYVDSYTYLALFGLFVAQVTSSFVIAGGEIVRHQPGSAGKLLVIVVFVFAAAATTLIVGLLRETGRAALPWLLGLEAALLTAFVAMLLLGPPINGASDGYGIVTGLVAASAMGAQSVLVRLLMKGIPQTNVMTGNMTQLGIATTELVLAWRRCAHEPDSRAASADFATVRGQLWTVLLVAAGFLLGAAAGAVAFAATNLKGVLLAVAIVAALALWALCRDNSNPSS